tara:strand:- start:1242 stop:1904 length:663 start_codon:yes stop_codon:yes gene_type:complete
MNYNLDKARDLMVENQLRPNMINDLEILNIFRNTKKEDFLLEHDKDVTYSDVDISLDNNRGYLKNLHIAQLINSAKIKKNDKILHIGGMTGYVSVLLSYLCDRVIVIENNKSFIEILNRNIEQLKIENITVIESSLNDDYSISSTYDIVFIDNPVYEISENLKSQVNNSYGKLLTILKQNDYLSKAYKITNFENNFSYEFLFDVFTKNELYKKIETRFIF